MKKVILTLAILSASATGFAKDNSEAIFQKNFADKWAFTFDRGVLTCYPGKAVFITNPMTDTMYPINGAAQMQVRAKKIKASDFDTVWKDSADGYGKVSISTFIDIGLKLCD